LRADQPSEPERPAGNRQLVPRVVDDLEEEPRRRAALVQLARRVQVARAEAVRDDAAGLLARAAREAVEPLLRVLRRVDKRLQADVVARPRLGEEEVGRALGPELEVLARLEHLLCPVLRLLDVRLVERVDLQVMPGNGGRELPAEELGADVERVVEERQRRLAVGRVRALARRGDEALALLARRLREQLLGPEPELARRLLDADLVAAVEEAVPEGEAELEAWVVVALRPALLRHL